VRLSERRAPAATVARYAEQMKAGAVFPAIVVNDRYELVDGNMRWAAASRTGRATIAAYVCSGLSALGARSLSVELNQCHGLSMTEEEIQAFVANAIQDGQTLDTRAYARMTGMKASTLSRWIAAKRFQMRAEREAIPAEDVAELSTGIQAALQVAKLRSVFKAATALAIDAKVSATQLKAIITNANSASSEAQALAVVATAREERSQDIKAIAAGLKPPRRRGGDSPALHIGGLLRFDVEDLLDVAPERQPETFARLCTLQDRLEAAVRQAAATWALPDAPPQGSRGYAHAE
jgi:ParB-like chromosome segregation protein Spo0J